MKGNNGYVGRNIEYVRPPLYKKQRDAIFNDSRYSLIEASTKTGKTVGCLVWLVEQAIMGEKGQNFWWVAPVSSQAEIAFRRVRMALPRNLYRQNLTKMTIELPNGAVIWFKSADKPDSLYGEDVYAAVIDEASRVKEDAWHAVRSTLTATGGKLRIIGNVKGKVNWFYVLCRKAQSGEKGMEYHKITAYHAAEAGVLDKAEIEDAKSKLPDHVFRELYLAEPADDGGNPFGIDAIRACIAPLSDAPPMAFGWDLAKSVDWTVGIGLDAKGSTSRFHRWQSPWGETVQKIRTLNGTVPALVDSTGVGDPIVESLQRGLLPNSPYGNVFEGEKFTMQGKQQLMEGLAIAIQRQEIAFPDGVIVQELELFEYEYTRTGVRYTAPPGAHDDTVMALALANKKLRKPQSHFFAVG